MKSIWIANYENNEIKIENTWFRGERLFVNGELQDEKKGVVTSTLTGKIQDELIIVKLGGFFKVKCKLLINDIEIETKQIK